MLRDSGFSSIYIFFLYYLHILDMCIGAALSTHITHVRNIRSMRKKNNIICNKETSNNINIKHFAYLL